MAFRLVAQVFAVRKASSCERTERHHIQTLSPLSTLFHRIAAAFRQERAAVRFVVDASIARSHAFRIRRSPFVVQSSTAVATESS